MESPQRNDNGLPRPTRPKRESALPSPGAPFRRLNLASAYQLAGEVTGEDVWFDRAVEAALSTLEVAPPKGG